VAASKQLNEVLNKQHVNVARNALVVQPVLVPATAETLRNSTVEI